MSRFVFRLVFVSLLVCALSCVLFASESLLLCALGRATFSKKCYLSDEKSDEKNKTPDR